MHRPSAAVPDPVKERSAAAFRAFSAYLRWYAGRAFHGVRVARSGVPAPPSNRPLIICSNHPGWWDPAMFILFANALLPGRAGFGPMEAGALKRYGIFRKMGVFGIETETQHGARDFLRISQRILSDPRHMLFITAEGAFTDPRSRPVRLRPGIAHLARLTPDAVILPLALEYVFWNESKPEALAYFGPPVEGGANCSVAGWTEALERALTDAIDALARLSQSRNPALFDNILRGRSGVGGVYDFWRQGQALWRGERFDPSHEGQG